VGPRGGREKNSADTASKEKKTIGPEEIEKLVQSAMGETRRKEISPSKWTRERVSRKGKAKGGEGKGGMAATSQRYRGATNVFDKTPKKEALIGIGYCEVTAEKERRALANGIRAQNGSVWLAKEYVGPVNWNCNNDSGGLPARLLKEPRQMQDKARGIKRIATRPS